MSGTALWDPQTSTIALQAGQNAPAPPNFLAMAGQAQQLQSGALQNQLAGMQAQGRQALSSAYQNTPLDPNTGLPNTNALIKNLMSTPGGGVVIPDVIAATQKQQENQYNLQKAGLDQATARIGAFGSALAPALALGNNVSSNDVWGAVARLNAAGVPVGGMVNQIAATMPTNDPSNPDPNYGAKLHQWVLGVYGSTVPATAQAGIFLSKPTMADTGGQLQSYDANPVTNPGAPTVRFGKTLTPGQAVAPVDGQPNAAGGPTKIPTATFAQNQGLGGFVAGGPSAFGNVRTGGLPPALVNPNGPPPGSGAGGAAGAGDQSAFGAAGGDPSGGAGGTAQPVGGGGGPAPMTVGLGPGQSAGLAAAGASSAKQWADLQSQVGGTAAGGGSAGRIFQLQGALGDLQALGPNGSGAGSDTWNNLKSYFNTIPGVSSIIGFDPNTIANYNMANKALTNYAAARAGAHGPGTDMQMATTLSSNASTHISNLAAQQVVQANIGLERMDQAQAQAFAQSGKSPDQFSTFSANWNASQDPRAYVADQLPPQKVVALVNSMSPADRAKFENTYTTGIRNGWITPPAWAQPAAPAAGVAPSTADIATNPGGVPAAAPAAGMVPRGY